MWGKNHPDSNYYLFGILEKYIFYDPDGKIYLGILRLHLVSVVIKSYGDVVGKDNLIPPHREV